MFPEKKKTFSHVFRIGYDERDMEVEIMNLFLFCQFFRNIYKGPPGCKNPLRIRSRLSEKVE